MNELNEKLAKWVEIREAISGGDIPNTESIIWDGWDFPDGTLGSLPNFTKDLNACFNWLVPKALKALEDAGYCPPILKLFQLWYDELVSLTGDSSNVKQSAKALCLAIEELIDGEKK